MIIKVDKAVASTPPLSCNLGPTTNLVPRVSLLISEERRERTWEKSVIVAVTIATVFSRYAYESNRNFCTLEEKRNFVPVRNRAESLHEANRFRVS